jgi:hypothetical protein
MAYADEKASVDIKILKIQRYIDWIEGVNSNTFGPNEATDAEALAHTTTTTGGGDAYYAWWRTQYPTADENTTGDTTRATALVRAVYAAWKDWDDNGSDVATQEGAVALAKLKSDLVTYQADSDNLQDNIDNDAPSIAL